MTYNVSSGTLNLTHSLTVCLSVCLSVCQSVHLSVCLYMFLGVLHMMQTRIQSLLLAVERYASKCLMYSQTVTGSGSIPLGDVAAYNGTETLDVKLMDVGCSNQRSMVMEIDVTRQKGCLKKICQWIGFCEVSACFVMKHKLTIRSDGESVE